MIRAGIAVSLCWFSLCAIAYAQTDPIAYEDPDPAGGQVEQGTVSLPADATPYPAEGSGSALVDEAPVVTGTPEDVALAKPDDDREILAGGSIYCVQPAGNDSNSGLGWALAKRTVQAALTAAVAGDEVWVAAGTYVERITLKNGVGLYGGFDGTETDRSGRNWTTNIVTLDGNLGGSVVTAPSGSTAATVIDGFTIRNGSGTGSTYKSGGGIYCDHSSATISNNTVTQNATNTGGGGIYCYYASPVITGNTITGNTATYYGAGIYIQYASSPVISNNTITQNTTTYDGGGINCGYASSATITNNSITSNSAGDGAGIYYNASAAMISNNRITGNTAVGYGDGGGVYCYGTPPTITNNTIAGNSAYYGGGVYCLNCAVTIVGNTITDNTANYAGGIYSSQNTPLVVNNVVSFNSSGIYQSSGTVTLRNNDVFGNTSYNYSGLSPGAGDISQDPLFVNRSGGDYHLQATSLCVNVGDDTVVQAGEVDMDGEIRISGAHVDIGADEFMTTSTPATPTFNPDGASFISTQSVTVACGTPGAEIHYTTNGVDPVQTDALVTGPVVLDKTATLKARAWKSGWNGSAVKSAVFTGKVATPSFSPDGGTYTSAQNVTITCATSGAEIHYTTNGNDPTQGDPLVSGAVQVSIGLTLKARAWKTGLTQSDVKVADYVIQVATPTFSPGGGTYGTPLNVTISCSTSGAEVHYTTNGNDPTQGDALVAGPVAVSAGVTLKARAWKTGWAASNVASAVYVFKVATPTFSPSAGTYNVAQNVTISCSTPGAVVHYTTNGVDPTEADPVVSGTVLVDRSMTLKARGWHATDAPSDVKSGVYAIKPVTPTFSPDAGTYVFPVSVTIGCSTSGAEVHYTTNGIDPTQSDPLVTGPVTISAALTLKARAWKNPFDPSDIKSAVYSAGKPIYVKTDGNDGNSGLTWALAKQTVQAAITTAVSGDEVYVAAGTYVERITLKDGVRVYGGFAGNETARDQRDWRTNITVLDGNRTGVVVSSGSFTSATVIDGFTIQNASGTTVSCTSSMLTVSHNIIQGGTGNGVRCLVGAVTVTNNTITGNSGWGVYSEAASPRIYNNTISTNGSGGIYCTGWYSGDWWECHPRIASNTIVGNGGSAIYHTEYAGPYIYNNILAYNRAGVQKGSNTYSYTNDNIAYRNGTYDMYPRENSSGAGYTFIDPKLADPAHGDFHIRPDSPCRDAGDDSWGVQVGATDTDEQPRIQGAHVDIGADESQGEDYPVHTAVVRVSPDGNDANDGSAWNLAKLTIQSAINALSVGGGEVWVKAAAYNERITLLTDVGVYGGFAGSETARDQRDPGANITILDGQRAGNVVTADGYLVFGVVDGFIIQGGTYGVYCRYAVATISNNTIIGNGGASGGGVYCLYCAPTIEYNAIVGNSSPGNGGGLNLDSAGPWVYGNLIINNTAVTNGGGIYSSYGYPEIFNNRIGANKAASGAGVYTTNGDTDIQNNVVFENVASSNAGGIYNNGSYGAIANNTIVKNTATGGGGLYLSSTHATVMNNIVAFNSSGLYGASFTPPNSSDFGHNCVFGNTGYAYSGCPTPVGDITADPQLVSVAYGNMHIHVTSPCREGGDYVFLGYGELDIDGQDRVTGTIDIGADESYGETWDTVTWIVRVSPQGDDANDGSTWPLAKRTVQAAIDAVSLHGGEVWVQAGTYNENVVVWASHVYVYGGFDGSETARDQRDWRANPTVLDGQQNGSVVYAAALGAWNVVDGFTIHNGNGTQTGSVRSGGGIYCFYSSPTVTNNTITGNTVTYCGGGIYEDAYSSPSISNNTITSNGAQYGGGVYCSDSYATISNNILAANGAEYGGGMYCAGTGGAPVTGNTFVENAASVEGGGICCDAVCAAKISNNLVAFNSSGLFKAAGSGTPTLTYNDVAVNTAYGYSGIADPTGTAGNISLDPLLVNREGGDYHLASGSPCIEAGDPAGVYAGQRDMDGDSRLIGPRVDIGADEFVPTLTVTGISPSAGVNTGNVTITNLAGTGFLVGATVKLARAGQLDINATNVVVAGLAQITCTFNLAGAATGAWSVVVTNPDARSATLTDGFVVVLPPPTVTGITPGSGPSTGSVNITNLAGTGFVAGAAVKLTRAGQADVSATNVAVVSATQITCTFAFSGAAAGVWNVVVTNPDAQSGTLANAFTVNPPPTVTSITPNAGLNNGSVSITNLAGTGFVAGAAVKLARAGQSDINATAVTVVSATRITCTLNLSGAAAGAWNVVVTNSDAQSGTLANGFTIGNPTPTVTGITPNSGLNSGSVDITNLAGTGFLPGAAVKLTRAGQSDINGTAVTVVSATQITCTFNLSGAAVGAWSVVVTNTDTKYGTLTNGFTIGNPAPTVTGITPDSGLNNGSVNVTNLAGTGFLAGAAVKLTRSGQSDIVGTAVTVASATQITCTFNLVGAAVGAWNVVVTNSDAQSGTLANGFTIGNPAPTVTSITPNSGANNGSVSITNLAGTGFLAGATVKLTRVGQSDVTATNVTVVSAAQITCTFNISGAAVGTWNVVVTNTDTQSGTLTEGFAVTNPAPAVTGIAPNSCPVGGSVNITDLAGTGFLAGATVRLTRAGQSDVAATNVTVVSATQITCTLNLSGAAAGAWNVVVTNPDAQSGTLPNGFTVDAPPTVTGITPNSGFINGSVNITDLAGTGFLAGASVRLTQAGQADINATAVTVVSATQITCTFNLSGAAIGLWNVVVTNTDTQSAVLNGGFSISGLPDTITIGTGTASTYLPFGTWYHDERTQVIYLASEIGVGTTIRGLALDVTTIPGQVMNNWTVRMKHTSLSSYSTPSWETGWTVVYQGNEPRGATGWRTFNFTTPFNYNGTSNLMIDFSFNNGSYTSNGMCRYSTPGDNRTIWYQTDSGYGDPLAWSGTSNPTPSVSTLVPNIQLVLTPLPLAVAGITPSSAYVDTSVSVTNLAGNGFQTGATAKLRRAGQADIDATALTVVSVAKITCTFNLAGAVVGPWDVVVTNPDSQSATLAGGFSVTALPSPPSPPTMTDEPPYTSGTYNTVWWGAVSGADQYYVEWDTSGSFVSPVGNSGWITGTGYTAYGLTDGQLYYYHVKARNAGGEGGWSNIVSSRQCTAPWISYSPYSQQVLQGNPVTFTVSAGGTSPLTYRWRKNGVDIPGATGTSYTIGSVVLGDAGAYDVVVENACGSATSYPAVLTVRVTVPADFDGDSDVDLDDFTHFRSCFNGPNRSPAGTNCSDANLDGDAAGDVDLDDFTVFRSCFNGPNRPVACD